MSVIDLEKAYLQIRMHNSILWSYQTIVFKERRCCLTRLGFGQNVAPLIMSHTEDRLKSVLSQNSVVRAGISAYIDILVNENIVTAERVQHLNKQVS